MSFVFNSLAATGFGIHGHNAVDKDGNPAGGYAADGVVNIDDGQIPGLFLRWQDGPVDRKAGEQPNGAFIEDVLEVLIRRLEFYQASEFACEENARALEFLKKTRAEMLARRQDRQDRGVEGKHEP